MTCLSIVAPSAASRHARKGWAQASQASTRRPLALLTVPTSGSGRSSPAVCVSFDRPPGVAPRCVSFFENNFRVRNKNVFPLRTEKASPTGVLPPFKRRQSQILTRLSLTFAMDG
jgi:hypothetical protein